MSPQVQPHRRAPGSGAPEHLIRETSACGQRSQSPPSPGSLFQMLVCNKTPVQKGKMPFLPGTSVGKPFLLEWENPGHVHVQNAKENVLLSVPEIPPVKTVIYGIKPPSDFCLPHPTKALQNSSPIRKQVRVAVGRWVRNRVRGRGSPRNARLSSH